MKSPFDVQIVDDDDDDEIPMERKTKPVGKVTKMYVTHVARCRSYQIFY